MKRTLFYVGGTAGSIATTLLMSYTTLSHLQISTGFIPSSPTTTISKSATATTFTKPSFQIRHASKHDKSEEEEDDQDEENDGLVTKEMFYRDMLADPFDGVGGSNTTANTATVKRKKKGRTNSSSSRYRTLDNRDNLPFLVKVTTPDPYTSDADMKRAALRNTERDRKSKDGEQKNKNKNNKKKKKNIRHNLIGMDAPPNSSISSSIYTRHDDGTLQKVLGEFALDKSTNCGDIVQVGDGTEYQVQTARCQYKYAGGKRFVMVRKILEVKEIKRVLVEQEMKELFEKDVDGGGGDEQPFLE